MSSIVEEANLERANGRLWGAEVVMNSFAGPPAGGFLLAAAFALPFFVDSVTFGASAALILTIAGQFRPVMEEGEEAVSPAFLAELKEGVRCLWNHQLFRPMAISLGVMNGTFMVANATYVLFVQEILGLDAAIFGALLTAGAAGGVVGSLAAARLSKRIGQGPSLF